MFISVDAPHFVAALELENKVVIRAPPILKWTLGRHYDDLRRYFRKRGW